MEIKQSDLKKISRDFRKIASNVINAHYDDQNMYLKDLIEYIDSTDLLKEYINSLSFDVVGLDLVMEEVRNSYGMKKIDLGSDRRKRIYIIYKIFKLILEKEYSTYYFGWSYVTGSKYQDMSDAFGRRLVFPFVSEIENYIHDIMNGMVYDANPSNYNITVNSPGVQVNISDRGGNIEAEQSNNINSEQLIKAIKDLELSIEGIDECSEKNILSQNLDLIKNEMNKNTLNINIIQTALYTLKLLGSGIVLLPDFLNGIQTITNYFGISLPL